MRRILAIVLLAAILLLALSLPALAKPSSPPNAFGEYNVWQINAAKNYGLVYGRDCLRWIMFATWYGTVPWDNGGDYVRWMKEEASY